MSLNFLRKKRCKHENAEIEMLMEVLARNKIDFDISEVYRIGGTVYDSALLDGIRKQIAAKNLDDLMQLSGINVRKDLIEIYLLVGNKGKKLLIGLIDPYELYDNPTLIGYSWNVDCNLGALSESKIR